MSKSENNQNLDETNIKISKDNEKFNLLSQKPIDIPLKIINSNNKEIDNINPLSLFEKIIRFNKVIQHNFKRKFFSDNINKTIFILNILSLILYYLSLQSCGEDATECLIKNGFKFYVWIGVFLLISSFFFSLFISIIIFTEKFFIHLLYVLPIYFFFFCSYTGTNVDEHGLYNFLAWFVFCFILIPVIITILLIIKFIKTNQKLKLFFIILSIVFILFFYNIITPEFKCDNWEKGLNNTSINNDRKKYKCRILIPTTCKIDYFNGTFDLSKKYRPTCEMESLRKKEYYLFKKIIGNQFNIKYNRYGYPITTINKFDMQQTGTLKEYQYLVMSNSIPMELYNDKNSSFSNYLKPEVEVEFDEEKRGKIYINVNRNETLISERKKLQYKKSLYNNILIIYLDAVSRNQFRRKLNKVSKIIKPYFPYNKNITEKKYSAFEFLKYNTLQALTYPNIKAMFYGIPVNGLNGTNIVKYFKERGYITGHTGTTCGKEIFSINKMIECRSLDYNTFDHENIALFCDPNFYDYSYSLTKGVASILQRCLYGKPAYEYAMEYTIKFWETYIDQKKFYRIHMNEAHEGTMEVISYLESPLEKFVKYFFERDYLLKDTVVLFVSDHGNHMLGPWKFLFAEDFNIESTLGLLIIVLPNNDKLYNSGIYNHLNENQQTFITPYDIHDTLVHICFGDIDKDILEEGEFNYKANNAFSGKGESVFNGIAQEDRFCTSKFNYIMARSDCKCKLW